MYLCTQQFHPVNIECLANRIFLAHKDLTFQPQQGCCRSSCYTVLSGTGLGNDSCFSHFLGQQCLPQNVIDFMGTGMVQIFSFKIDLCTSKIFRHLFCIIQQRRTVGIFPEQPVQLRTEFRIIFVMFIAFLQMLYLRHQRFRNITSAMDTVSTLFVPRFTHSFLPFP